MIQMESSFLEDLLKREVDQNQVNALVGSLENQLTTPRSSSTPSKTTINVKSENITSISQLVSQAGPRKDIITGTSVPINLSTGYVRYVKSPTVTSQTNGSVSFDTKLLATSNAASATQAKQVLQRNNVIISSSPKPMTPPASRQLAGAPISLIVNSVNSVTPQVSIAPKITNTVPIAPRIGTNIMITPARHAQLLMAQRLGTNALMASNLIAQMPGGIPVVPRIPGSAIAVPPIMNTQIPGIRTVVGPRGPSIITNMTQKVDPRLQMNARIPGTSLAQIKSNASVIPGQINYRFRQVNPNSAAAAAAAVAASQVTTVNGVTPQAAAVNITMMKESVKRLKEFFQNLINLACGANQPPEIGKMVKELVHNLMQGKVTEEEFIEKLQKTLKSDPQPNLVHFLKKTLPHLRETIKKQQIQQMQTKGQPQPVQPQPQPPQAQVIAAVSSAAPLRPNITTIAGNRLPTIINGQARISPHHILTNKSLTLQEQQMLQKQIAQHGRIVVASTGQVTPGMRTAIQPPIHGVASLAANKGFIKPQMGATPGMLVASVNTAKEKPRNTYYSSAVGGDDDINDVTCMAGVNLMEESQKILATGADFMSYQTRSVKDQPLVDVDHLKSRIEQKVKKCGLQGVSSDALAIVSHALEDRLRTILERLTACSLHRNDPHLKEDVRYETISTVRTQLRVFEEIDEVERKHRESREREMLMRVAKSRSRTEDPEQARLKEKAKQMQQEEEEMNRKRAANQTALEAIGPRKKRKLDEALESLSKAQTPSSTSTTQSTSSNSLSSQVEDYEKYCSENEFSLLCQGLRSRQHRITLRDLIFILETEKRTCKSTILYRAYLR